MKNKIIALLFLILPMAAIAESGLPTDSLRSAVDGLIGIASNPSLTDIEKKSKIIKIVKNKVDVPVVARRVVSRHWKKASKEQQNEFIDLFTRVLVNTYFVLLNRYTDEKVEYLKEEIKKKKYAKIVTNIVVSDKKIPVNYKMILRKGHWRIYDFSAEGVSFISSYSSDYKSTLKRGGLSALNEALTKKLVKSGG